MKKSVVIALTAIGLLVVITACNKSSDGNSGSKSETGVKKLIVGTNPGSALQYFDDNEHLTGFEIELLRAIDEKLPQYTVDFVTTEYRSMFPSLKSNRIDLVTANLRRNIEREDYLHTWRGYNYWANKIIVFVDNTAIRSLEDLDGLNVGTGQGTLSATFMENYIKNTGKKINLVYSNDSIGDMLARRIDCFIVADYLVDAVYNRQYKDQGIQLKAVGDPIDTNEGVETDRNVYFFFADGNEDARDAFSGALYELRQDGTLAKLMLQFLGQDRSGLIDESEEIKQMKELGKI
jgi:L-cystine transport system substrate-binding protein